jgi:steroid 5-alpha reductase family enzyme
MLLFFYLELIVNCQTLISFRIDEFVFSLFLFQMIPFDWFAESSSGPYLLTFMSISTVITFVLGFLTQNYSQVDKAWSFLPPIYCSIVLLTSPIDTRIMVMHGLAWMWGLRLTSNFARKGGYTWAGEDYRWPVLRRIINNRFLFELFNLTFIAIFQNFLLLFLASPIFYVASHQTLPWNIWDVVCTFLFVVLFIVEVTADQQQWNFHQEKQVQRPGTEDGFLRTGLFRYSRHPNFFAEICLWWIFYAFTYSAQPSSMINWTILGTFCLTCLINGSTTFTESISSSKYPKYKLYQKTTSRLIPWWSTSKAE